MDHTAENHQSEVPCCPPLEKDNACDVLDFHYRLKHPTTVLAAGQRVTVEVLIHARFERCTGPLVLGDLAYSTTLLPGEKVRLFTSDRRTRFTLDTQSKVSYRHEQTSEERYYMASMHDFMSDVSVRDSSSASSSSRGSAKGHAETSGAIESFFAGPSVDVSGSYEASSSSTFLRELSQHASSSDRRAEVATRAASSVSVGEVSSRSHTQAESEDHFESSSREFSNPNKCHAVTFYFYQINKIQTVKFSIVSIERRVIDPAANTRVSNNPFVSSGDVAVIPNGVLATDENRLTIEERARASVLASQRHAFTARSESSFPAGIRLEAANFQVAALTPIPANLRQRALRQVDEALLREGLLDRSGKVSTETVKQFSFERQTSLPTPGLLVKGCLDECNICEPELQQQMQLELEHKKLQNELLKRQIELLDKSQEYRCCPEGFKEETDE